MHRAETIMQTMLTTLTGLATTGVNIARSRRFPALALPALTLAQGGDKYSDSDTLDVILRELTVVITAHIAEADDMETTLNQIRTEVFAALQTDYTLGLSYVYNMQIQEDAEPDISKSPTVIQAMTWLIIYEHSKTTTEA